MVIKVKFHAEKCPICGKGMWVPHSDGVFRFRYGRKEHQVGGQHYAQCDDRVCRARGYLPGQRDANRVTIREYQAQLPGYISPSDVLAVREKYLLTQKAASLIFGGGVRSFSKWERGETAPAGPTARLIRFALKYPDVMKDLAAEVGIKVTIDNDGKDKSSRKSVVAFYIIRERSTSVNFKEEFQAPLLDSEKPFKYEPTESWPVQLKPVVKNYALQS